MGHSMTRARKTLALVTSVFVIGLADPPKPAAAQACSDMLIPVVQLKTIGRGVSRGHAGIDLMAPYGSPVRAAAAGIVVSAGWSGEYGKMIDLRSKNGMVTRYAHLSVINAKVRVGRPVASGQTIGAVGMTGNTTGPHLHFEVRFAGHVSDPARLLFAPPKAVASRPRTQLAQLHRTKTVHR
jgi:murein DD-endopeptidase MepM/ murein hydrolase activator NlpD